ncbi:cyclophilin-type peptidylprolyl cis-trans isomerase [Cavenderia fasciculata]|uniref:peptidylprolyl isomerase n=1 Tax=Cavenderia fasciculata TaxID=261658 RepID=F4PT77_CACFS|nr:cyclophilin-type peptidylprolyl cis-trans isomerase [Cavenderia fasciculata]EGG20813.1 cyclophilin-type peptidylprolyl cis-trans isomerase [Cavenderia fasciculata]|eukprot:XP_004358663.1 cyclophilin-type peptidylprolyl cis-trans isomerase [Cavenderia fasciculata]
MKIIIFITALLLLLLGVVNGDTLQVEVDESYQPLTAPDTFVVAFTTTKGSFSATFNRSWAPYGVDHFYTLIQAGYYNDNAFFRVIDQPRPFVAQWGIASDPAVSQKWNITIPEDSIVGISNVAATITYAAEMNSQGLACCRTTQLFINYGDNSFLDPEGFIPIGMITSGFNNVLQFYSGYGENVDQGLLYSQGAAYLKNFPSLDYLQSATLSN